MKILFLEITTAKTRQKRINKFLFDLIRWEATGTGVITTNYYGPIVKYEDVELKLKRHLS